MEQTETRQRQSLRRNLADFTSGIITSVYELPLAAYNAIMAYEKSEEERKASQEEFSSKSLAFKAGNMAIPMTLLAAGLFVIGYIGFETIKDIQMHHR